MPHLLIVVLSFLAFAGMLFIGESASRGGNKFFYELSVFGCGFSLGVFVIAAINIFS